MCMHTDKRLNNWLSGAVITTCHDRGLEEKHASIMSSTEAAVEESFRFLANTISQDLKWDTHIDFLNFLHQLSHRSC